MAPLKKKPSGGMSDTDRQQLEELLDERRFWARLWAMLKRASLWVLALVVGVKTLTESGQWIIDKLKSSWFH